MFHFFHNNFRWLIIMTESVVRSPVVAGMFYPDQKDKLIKLIEEVFLHPVGVGKLPGEKEIMKGSLVGAIVPHAGYIYSGPIASHAYFEISKYSQNDIFIIIGPDHYGLGSDISIYMGDYWETPLGKVKIEKSIGEYILEDNQFAADDPLGHISEHSIEVQVPFLQYVYNIRKKKNFSILPITMNTQTPEIAISLGKTLFDVMRDFEDLTVIASSDLSHYNPYDVARRLDGMAIEAIEKGDPENFFKVIRNNNISACGYGPIMALMSLVNETSTQKLVKLAYANSGDTGGDKTSVVGYAAFATKKK